MASDGERRQLANRMHQLLLKQDGVILLNSFWSSYQQVYKELPDPARFGQRKRNALLSIFPSVCSVDSAPVSHRKVWVKDIKRQGGLGAEKYNASGEAASQQPKQSVRKKVNPKVKEKVKQPYEKFAGITDVAVATCKLRENESVNAELLTGDADKLADPGKKPKTKLSKSTIKEEKHFTVVKASTNKIVPTKIPLSKKDLNLEESNIKVIQEGEGDETRFLPEPAKMASSRRLNTHVRFGDDEVDAVQVPWTQRQMHHPSGTQQMNHSSGSQQMHHHAGMQQMHHPSGTQQYPSATQQMHPPRAPQYNQFFPQSPGYNNRNTPFFPHVVPSGAQPWQQRQPAREPAPPPQHRPVSRVPEDQMKNVVDDSIDRLVESKEYVSLERIEKLITQHYHVSSLGELGIRGVDTIPSVREHQRMLCKVNAYIQAFVKVRAVATAFELGECLKTYATDDREFDSLRLGPLVAQPLVYEFFKMPADCDVPAVTTHDIYEHLRGFLNANDLWTDRGVQLEDFMQYLTEKYDVDTPFKLGIRIRSMPLLIGVLKKAQRECGQTMATLPTHLRDMIDADLTTAAKRFLLTIIHKEPGICMVRQQCLDMTPSQLFKHVFCKFSVLVEFIGALQTMHPKSGLTKVARHCKNIQGMMYGITKDELMMKLFQFVVCCSKQELHGQLEAILALEYGRAAGSEPIGENSSKELPSLEKVVTQIRKYLERCLTHGALSLSNLARVEEKLLEDFHLTYFSDLGRGGFLQFLLDTSNIKQFLDECGGLTLGGASGGVAAESTFHPSFSALLEFVHQFGMMADKSQHAALEGALCNHYRVKEVKCLGHGSVAHLVTSVEKQSKHNQESIVYYEGALCASNRTTVFSTTGHQVGLHGHVTKEKALACLQSCPLLENMSEWSHWQFVFKPELGELREFLHKYGGVRTIHVAKDNGAKMQMMTNIVALETSPGTLLRISANSTPEAFATAAADADVSATCCHLVSLVAANRGMSNMPQALLANHMMTALLKIQGRHAQQTAVTPGVDDAGSSEVVQFVLDCLVKMPLIICEAIANQVLLEPLSKVLGSTKSKALLLRLADSGPALTRLQLLGWLLGHADWTDSFTELCNPPADGVTASVDNSFDGVIEVLDSSNESDDDDYENSILVLSDDDDDVVQILDGATTTSDTFSDDKNAGAVKYEKIAEASVSSTKLTSDDDAIMVDVTEDVVDTIMKTPGEEVTCSDDDRCRTLVEQIRSDEFGIGVALGEDGERLMRKQQERLGRSLDRLSRDLYNKDTHFVLELIQNADDNSYPDEMFGETATTRPAVKFVVESDCIVVYNNECGFEEQNIRAVCDVGRTTKGKHKYGYIGQKGIGFKSVFRVTDCPKIHSNGFHICFDVKSSPMGYILPHWIGEDGGRYATGDRWNTRIELPLKEDMRNQTQCRSLAARFHDVHPSLLLFLHRLKRLTVQNKVEDVTTNIERRDLGSGVVEIRHNDLVDRWLVVKHMLDASAISLQAKSGVEIESTEVALAFPLRTQEKGLAQTQPEKQRVFAFLPLRSYGFRFVIQGDFDVPASRGDVDRDSMWNQWLRSELHLVFVQALQHFKSHPEFSEIEAVTYFLRFIPLDDEILEFFKPVASAILQLLRREPCLPTEVTTDTGVQWKLPSQLVLTKDPLVRDVITSSLLRDHLGLDFLHKDVAAMLNPSLMTSLGVQLLTTSHLIEIGKVIVSRMSGSNTVVRQHATAQVAKWLACVYRSLDEFDQNEELMAKLKDVVVVPLMSGDVVSLTTKTVFFPIDSAEQMRLEKTKTERPLEALMCDLSMLHPAFLAALDGVSHSQVSHLLEQLGVKHLEPQDIVKHHIMPTLQSDGWKTRPSTLLVSYVVYLKQQWDRNRSLIDLDQLRPVAVVMTNQGIRRPADEPVHLSRRYGNKIDLPGALPAYDWLMLHDCYAQSAGMNWREFFLELGVLDFLSVKERVVTITPTELESTPWAVYKAMLPAADEYKISDYESRELEALLRSCSGATSGPSSESMHRQMRTLFELIDDQWDVKYAKYAVTQIADGNGHVLRRDVDTTFAILLKSSPWLPSCVMRVATDGGKFSVTLCHETMRGSDLFVRVPEISHLLGDHVPYLEAQTSTKSTLASFLGIQNSIKVEFVVGLLQGWCERTTAREPRQFRTSKQHIQAIYRYLFENMPPKQLQDLVHDTPLIFVAESLWQDWRAMVDGVFRGRDEVRWDDPSCLFAKYRESLAGSDSAPAYRLAIRPLYADMEDFFLQCARVQRVPELLDHAQLLVHVVSTVPLPQALPDLLRIFTIIGDLFVREPDLVKGRVVELMKVLRGSSAIPVKGCRWVSLDSHPMVSDDKDMERLFQGKEGVYFVDVGERLGTGSNRNRGRTSTEGGIDNDLVLTCLKELGVATLSECLSEDYVTEMYEPCRELQQYVHDVLPMIQTLLCNEFPTTYAQLVASNMAEKIKAMSFVKVGRLELVYRLKNKPETVAILSEKCHLVRDKELCVHRDHVKSFNEVNKELARYFSVGNMQCRNEIRDLLLELLPLVVNPSWELQQFVKQRRLDELPSKEEQWLVEEPVYYHQPPQAHAPQHFEETMNVDEGQIQPCSRNQDSRGGDNSGGLRAWPPRSGNPDMRQRGGTTAGGGSHMWPPPAPPKGVDYTALPLGLRPSKLPSVSREGAPTHQTADSGHVSRGSVPHGAMETSTVAGTATSTQDSERKSLKQGDVTSHASHTMSDKVTRDKSTPDGSTIVAHILNPETPSDPSAASTQVVAMMTASVNSEGNAAPLKKRRRSESLDAHHRKAFMDSAVWLQDNETPYEHVDIGSLTVPEGLAPNESDNNAGEGRWGEQLVYSYLVQSARNNPQIISVTWINQAEETGDPYDIVVTTGSRQDPATVSTIYIEVKSTVSDSKNFFEMSLQQIHFACEKNDAFHLYRVFNAGQQVAVRLMRLENIALKLDRKEVRLCMFV